MKVYVTKDLGAKSEQEAKALDLVIQYGQYKLFRYKDVEPLCIFVDLIDGEYRADIPRPEIKRDMVLH